MGRKKVIDEETIVKINLRNSVVGIGDFVVNAEGDHIIGPGITPECTRFIADNSGRSATCTIIFG